MIAPPEYKNTSDTLLSIISEISIIIYSSESNSLSTDTYEHWWAIYIYKLKEILLIITKKDRLIYLGIFFIVLSIVVYFIEISS